MRQSVFVTTLFVSLSCVAFAHAAALRTVAITGQPAPDTSIDVTYHSFDTYLFSTIIPLFRGPVLNDAGQVAFRADLTGNGVNSANNKGVWSEGTGSLKLVARTGSPAPGGLTFGTVAGRELFSPVLNDAGQTAFYGGLTNGSVGLWSEGSGSLAVVARDGIQAPGTSSGVNFSFTDLHPTATDLPKLNDAGQTAFVASLTGSGVIPLVNDIGIWSQGSGSLALVARAGSHAQGMPSGVNYGDNAGALGLNDAGQIAQWANLTGSGVNSSNDAGIWSGGSGSLALVAREGDPAPGMPGSVSLNELVGPNAINNAGLMALNGTLAGSGVNGTNDEGLWLGSSGSLALVARKGSQAPGTPSGVNYGTFFNSFWPVLNDAGQIAFLTELAGTGVDATNNEGIWSGETGNLSLVARRGDQAPDTTSGVNFSDLSHPALNSAGQIAFRADVTGTGVDSTNSRGIWATDQAGALQLVARRGESLEVAPGDFRTIGDLDFVSATGNSDGRSSGFNNFGQLVFWTSFTDGSQGVFVSNKVAGLPGDFNHDGTVDAADYIAWRKNPGGIYTPDDYNTWRANFGRTFFTGSGAAIRDAGSLLATVPEPAVEVLLATVAALTSLATARRQRSRSDERN